jgi:hypothetical protein
MAIRMTAGVLWLASATAVVLAQPGGGEADSSVLAASQPAATRVAFVYPSAFPVRGARSSCRP